MPSGVDIIARALAGKVAGDLSTKADLVDGKVPASELPSYVDDIVEYPDREHFPETGEHGKIYAAMDTGKLYRWSGTQYVEIPSTDDIYTKDDVDDLLEEKQDKLVAGTNIKTINGESILGGGNVVLAPGCPTTQDGEFALRAVVENGVVTYQWVADNAVRAKIM